MSFFAKWGTCNDVDHLPFVQLFCNALIFYILIISEIKKLLAWTAPSVGHWPGSRQDYCGLHMHKFGYFPWWLDFWWRYECSSIKICRMSKKVLATWKKSRILILMEHLKKKKKERNTVSLMLLLEQKMTYVEKQTPMPLGWYMIHSRQTKNVKLL